MRRIFVSYGSSLALFFLFSLATMAQAPRGRLRCGTDKLDTMALQSAIAFERNPANAGRLQATTRMVQIYLHVLKDGDAQNQAYTLADVMTDMQDMRNDYAANNMCFFIAGIDTIYSTYLNSQYNKDTDPHDVFDPYRVADCINIFYMNNIFGTNGSCNCGIGGTALGGIPGTFCLVSNRVGTHTTSHEVGHCLGLSHTFAAINGRECINGSNGLTAGDLVSDTPADPFSFEGESCYHQSVNGCGYFGNCTDPCGDNNYNPPYTNIMSYWTLGCQSNIQFTSGQFTRINSMISATPTLVLCMAHTGNYTMNAINKSSGTLIETSIGGFSTNGSINISGSAFSILGGSSAVLSVGFRAFPGSGSTTIKTSPCQ